MRPFPESFRNSQARNGVIAAGKGRIPFNLHQNAITPKKMGNQPATPTHSIFLENGNLVFLEKPFLKMLKQSKVEYAFRQMYEALIALPDVPAELKPIEHFLKSCTRIEYSETRLQRLRALLSAHSIDMERNDTEKTLAFYHTYTGESLPADALPPQAQVYCAELEEIGWEMLVFDDFEVLA